MKKSVSQTTVNVVGSIILVAIICVLVAVIYGAQVVCHRYIGPSMTGSNDPVAVALYCKPSR